MSCSLAIPGSPVFSPSRLPPNLLSFTQAAAFKDTPEPQHHQASSASPLRPFSLRAHHRNKNDSSALRRWRPAPLHVPVTTVDEVVLHHDDLAVEEEGDGFAAYCRKGKGRRRVQMEDRHVAAVGLGGDPRASLFGVFDGHGGKSAAEFAANNMPRIMARELQRAAQQGRTVNAVEDAVRRGYLRTDEEFRKAQDAAGGACCVTALLLEDRLVVSNAGDCRAVLSRAGKAQALTSDHRASRQDERDRIESQGGLVINCRGTWRVQGSLAVSRGIGDAHLKPWVVAEPDTTTVTLDEQCELVILASDGLWDKVDDQEAVDVARPLCCAGTNSRQLSDACKRLVELAASRGSTDDISVLVVQMQRFSAMLHG